MADSLGVRTSAAVLAVDRISNATGWRSGAERLNAVVELDDELPRVCLRPLHRSVRAAWFLGALS